MGIITKRTAEPRWIFCINNSWKENIVSEKYRNAPFLFLNVI